MKTENHYTVISKPEGYRYPYNQRDGNYYNWKTKTGLVHFYNCALPKSPTELFLFMSIERLCIWLLKAMNVDIRNGHIVHNFSRDELELFSFLLNDIVEKIFSKTDIPSINYPHNYVDYDYEFNKTIIKIDCDRAIIKDVLRPGLLHPNVDVIARSITKAVDKFYITSIGLTAYNLKNQKNRWIEIGYRYIFEVKQICDDIEQGIWNFMYSNMKLNIDTNNTVSLNDAEPESVETISWGRSRSIKELL